MIRKCGLLEAAPAGGGLAVEQRALARRGLRGQRHARQNQRHESEERTSHGYSLNLSV